MSGDLLRASHLGRVFGSRVAVADLTLSAGAGEVIALLGPNGAGKTTTFRMLAALLPPTSGEARIGGLSVTGDEGSGVRRQVGLLTEAPGLWERLTVRANLETYARLHGLLDVRASVEAAMRAVAIDERADERAGALSKGLKQRVAIARAILHDPAVLLLDEPTSGLDPANARHVRDLVRGFREQGRAVLVSTHNLTEAEALADRIAIINTRLIAFDTPRQLRARLGQGRVLVVFEGPALAWQPVAERAGVTVNAVDDSTLHASADEAVIPDLVSALVAAGARVRRVEPQQASLEDAYLALVRSDG